MLDSIHQRYEEWGLSALLAKYPDLRVRPSWGNDLVLAGSVAFRIAAPNGVTIEDSYTVELSIPPAFPSTNPRAYECDVRIPPNYHKLEGNYLCLGAPTALRLTLTLSPTLLTFLESLVIPYLAGYSYFALHGKMLYGELDHGSAGIREYLADLFQSKSTKNPEEFVRLASLKKRCANKYPCPCLSGRKLGKCHNRIVNALRKRLGRKWFQREYPRILGLLPAARPKP